MPLDMTIGPDLLKKQRQKPVVQSNLLNRQAPKGLFPKIGDTGDKFLGANRRDLITVLGTLSNAIAPNYWAGRAGKGLVEAMQQSDAEQMAQDQFKLTSAETQAKIDKLIQQDREAQRLAEIEQQRQEIGKKLWSSTPGSEEYNKFGHELLALSEPTQVPDLKKAIFPEESGISLPSDITKFELLNYGKLVPELRGTSEYLKKYNEAPEKTYAPNRFNTFLKGFAYNNPDLSAGELEAAATKEWDRIQEEQALKTGTARGEGFAASRMKDVIDTKTNTPVPMTVADLAKAQKEEPSRYISATQGAKALSQTALIEDMRGSINDLRQDLADPKLPEFTTAQRLKISLVLKNRDPASAMSNFLGSEFANTLTPEQQNYLVNVTTLIENAMAMRSVLGAGQGSDELRAAIKATIPSAQTPNKEYASKQLDRFEKTLDRLARGVLTAPLKGQEPNEISNAPNVGEIMDGYRFKGGNPADKNNWERLE